MSALFGRREERKKKSFLERKNPGETRVTRLAEVSPMGDFYVGEVFLKIANSVNVLSNFLTL
jgi:hypothetical protein